MSLPIGLVCKKCGSVFGALIRPNTEEVARIGKAVESICEPCATELSKQKGISLDSAENWAKIID